MLIFKTVIYFARRWLICFRTNLVCFYLFFFLLSFNKFVSFLLSFSLHIYILCFFKTRVCLILNAFNLFGLNEKEEKYGCAHTQTHNAVRGEHGIAFVVVTSADHHFVSLAFKHIRVRRIHTDIRMFSYCVYYMYFCAIMYTCSARAHAHKIKYCINKYIGGVRNSARHTASRIRIPSTQTHTLTNIDAINNRWQIMLADIHHCYKLWPQWNAFAGLYIRWLLDILHTKCVPSSGSRPAAAQAIHIISCMKKNIQHFRYKYGKTSVYK